MPFARPPVISVTGLVIRCAGIFIGVFFCTLFYLRPQLALHPAQIFSSGVKRKNHDTQTVKREHPASYVKEYHVSQLGRHETRSKSLPTIPSESAKTSLHAVGLKHNTDKAFRHGYTKFYERILRPHLPKIAVFIEVGVLEGASMRMWHEWLPRARIVGVDSQARVKFEASDGPRLVLLKADQTNKTQMDAIIKKWQPDVFLEDGCHREYCQQTTLSIVFPLLKSGAIYIVEDLHPCPYKLQSTCANPRTYSLLTAISQGMTPVLKSDCIPNLESNVLPGIQNITIWSRPKCGMCCKSTTAALWKR
mmetsp:Transcript_30641/g.66882  ORF Transcript_30641/g.66882 Transcript_30641/m.66882 type:complete len:306 (+) Transcript_30641:23-940(+)